MLQQQLRLLATLSSPLPQMQRLARPLPQQPTAATILATASLPPLARAASSRQQPALTTQATLGTQSTQVRCL